MVHRALYILELVYNLGAEKLGETGQFDLLERMKMALTPSARSISHQIWAWAFPVARRQHTLPSKYVTTLSAAASFHFLFTNYPL